MLRFGLAAGLLLIAAPARGAETARVELTIGAETPRAAATAQQWYEVLTAIGVDGLQIRQKNPGEAPEVVDQGTKRSPNYRVYGLLSTRNELIVPGHRFSIRDRDGIADWLKQLREEGIDKASGAANGPFGLTAEQLAQLREDLGRPMEASTTDLAPIDALPMLLEKLRHEVALDPAAQQALAAAEKNREELRGLSLGVGLTYLVRSAGLVVVPMGQRGGDVVLVVRATDPARESWPIGFEPEVKPEKLVPDIYEFLAVEIEDTAATDVLASLSERLELPMLFDHYALARQGIDLSTVMINLPEKRITYSMLLGKTLSQAKLKYELRVDEADRPFSWITTARPSR
ncbi:MAG: hypothetical protein SGJ19_11870 [Planctomycetia bacterium]|nr:hypothetical protein [Planctomycetia bacterium]